VFADDVLPVYDVSDEVATVVDAEPQIWEALMDADLLEVGKRAPLAGVLGALRMLLEIASDLLHGERPAHAPESLRVRELARCNPSKVAGSWSANDRASAQWGCAAGKPQKSVVSAAPLREPPDDGFASIGESDAQRREGDEHTLHTRCARVCHRGARRRRLRTL
jgi:hypothetical protein